MYVRYFPTMKMGEVLFSRCRDSGRRLPFFFRPRRIAWAGMVYDRAGRTSSKIREKARVGVAQGWARAGQFKHRTRTRPGWLRVMVGRPSRREGRGMTVPDQDMTRAGQNYLAPGRAATEEMLDFSNFRQPNGRISLSSRPPPLKKAHGDALGCKG